MRWCLKPDSFANFSKVSELNGGPLSVWSVWGMPCVEKIFFSFFLVPSKDVVVVNSISGYLEYWSVTTGAYFPFGNAPDKSISTAVQGLAGSSVIFGRQERYSELCNPLSRNVGKLLQFQRIEQMQDFVFPDPQWLIMLIKNVVRHDLRSQLMYKEVFKV